MKGALLIVFVLAQDASKPETQAFTTAALEVLGAKAEVRIVAVPSDPADLKVEAQATRARADGAIELSWTDDRSRAFAHCYVAGERRWIDRSISFGQDDDDGERGRMLGYAVASMFLIGPLPEGADAQSASGSKRELPRAGAPSDDVPRGASSVMPETAAPSDAPSSAGGNRRAFDFGGLVSHGVAGEADALGVSAAFRFLTMAPLWLRAGLSGRGGEIPAAQASMKAFQMSAGADLVLFDSGRFNVGLRGDLIGSWLEVTHLSADDPGIVRQHRWLFGADAVACGGLRLSAGTSLFAGAGLEAMFGRTDIYTHGVRVATIPPLRLIAELGLRSEF